MQFWFSVVAATVGFLYILYAAADFQADNWASLLKVLPGVVIDAVAVLFFRQAEQTRQRATELYDRLRIDSNTIVAKELLSSIEEVKIRSRYGRRSHPAGRGCDQRFRRRPIDHAELVREYL